MGTPRREMKIEKVYVTVLLKSLDKNNVAAATIITGVLDGTKNFQIRENQITMSPESLILRKEGSRNTYNARLHFREAKVFESFPFTVYVLKCELELSGTETTKFDLSIPSIRERNLNLCDYTNFVSIRESFYCDGIIPNTQVVYVDTELTEIDGIRQPYRPRMFIRFLRVGPWESKLRKFYFPYLSFWFLIVFADLKDREFVQHVAQVLIALVIGFDTMVDGKSTHELDVFNTGVFLFVAMICPFFNKTLMLYAPLAMVALFPYSYIAYSSFLKKHTLFKNKEFNTLPDNLQARAQNLTVTKAGLSSVNDTILSGVFMKRDICLVSQDYE